MPPEANEALIGRFWQIFNEARVDDNGSLDLAGDLDSILDPDCVLIHAEMNTGDEVHGRDGMKAFVSTIRTAFPDFWVFVRQQPLAEDDKVVTTWSATGTPESTEVQPAPALNSDAITLESR